MVKAYLVFISILLAVIFICYKVAMRTQVKYFVVYPDGERTRLMIKKEAQAYAAIFGGKVYRAGKDG